MTITHANIARYQARVADMGASKGSNHKSMPKKRAGKGHCTRRPNRYANGQAQSKTLRKREAALAVRIRGYITSVNESHTQGIEYTKPGSMKK